MRGRLDDLAMLYAAWDGEASATELATLDLSSDEAEAQEEAGECLDALPLAVEAVTTYEIVLGTGGPDDRLLVECDGYTDARAEGRGHEIRRILYRYSWSGSAEVELVGEDREVAERFARQVVPELVE